MKRIIIDSQSNRHFQGVPLEQNYDQRGGICQAGKGDIVVTTEPIDQKFLTYWASLGFDLPEFLVAGPFDPACTLSQLLLRNSELQGRIKSCLNGEPARLEFFCIEESERQIAGALGIPAYCNFDVSILLSRKQNFKWFFDQIGLDTPLWFVCKSKDDLMRHGTSLLSAGKTFLVKAGDGTGGIACGGMLRIAEVAQLQHIAKTELSFGDVFILEEIVPHNIEVSLHWEMQENREVRLIGIFEQLSPNFGYSGVVWPVKNLEEKTRNLIIREATEKLFPALRLQSALGFFCCDIIVGTDGVAYWIDFNPRKGAILYVHDMVRRLSVVHGKGKNVHFRHEHFRLPERAKAYSFSEVQSLLGDLLQPKHSGFAVVSNPGVISHGYCDITGVSWESSESAMSFFSKAKNIVLSLS